MIDLDPPFFFVLLIRTLDKFGDLEIMAPTWYQIANNTLMNDLIFFVMKKEKTNKDIFLNLTS